MDDLRAFYRDNYTQANLILGIAGGYDSEFLARVQEDFAALPKGTPPVIERPAPKPIHGIQVRMIEKNTRSVAYSIGFPITVTRGHPDYVPLLVAQSHFGQHRTSVGRLYQRMRHERGLNYGDYAYIEYFPRGMFQLEPDPNLVRPQQIFQVWIRPVEPATAHFALRLAMFELNRLVTDGLSEKDFENARGYLSKYVNLLTKTKNAELGYAIDSRYYGIQDYNSYLKAGLANLTVEGVNAAVKKHLRAGDLWIVVVANDCEGLKAKFLSGEPSPMTYNSEKPAGLLEEDKTIEKWKIPFAEDGFEIIPEDQVFE
jgi:zinc protease